MNPEQSLQIREQLIKQIQDNFPEDKKNPTIQQINSMGDEELEQFLIQNNLIKTSDSPEQQCIFCNIISGKIPSCKIAEDENAIAILEINPISKAHPLVIPKEHVETPEELQKKVESLAAVVSEKISKSLSPKQIKVSTKNITGHEILDLMPVYENETQESERKKASPEELEELKKIIDKSPLPEKAPPKKIKKNKIKQINGKKIWLPRRIP